MLIQSSCGDQGASRLASVQPAPAGRARITTRCVGVTTAGPPFTTLPCMTLSSPKRTLEQLEEGVTAGIERFRNERLNEEPDDYSSHFMEVRGHVEELIELTVDLTIPDETVGKMAITHYHEALRYVAAPPISSDDLETLSGIQPRYQATSENWRAVMRTIMAAADRHRFPWLLEGRPPTEQERNIAVIATAAQIASSRIATARRNEAKNIQEKLVKASLLDIGFEEVRPRKITTFRDFPEPGTLCGESTIAKGKADLVVGLWDDRILAIECKVSNTAVNSNKRIKETTAKAANWLHDIGATQIVPAAVLAGVYRVQNLMDAQETGLTVWWSQNIDELILWIQSTKTQRSQRAQARF